MSGLEDLIGYIPQLAPVVNAMGFRKTVDVDPELPYDLSEAGTFGKINTEKQPLYGLPRSTVPENLPTGIKSYRADPQGKYGGKEGLETQPLQRFEIGGNKFLGQQTNKDLTTGTTYSDSSKALQSLYRFARANGAAAANGHPALPAEDLAGLALKEGRFDYGLTGGSYGGKFADKYRKELQDKYNLIERDIDFLVSIADKQRIADKHKVSFGEAWNGMGTNDVGQTGKQYAKDLEAHKQAALHPKNKELMDIIMRGIEDGKKYGFPLRVNKEKDERKTTKEVPFKKGGSIEKPLAGKHKII
jgi:hypothetical protein